MAERFQHLDIARAERTNERRRPRGFGGGPPSDPKAHGKRLARELEEKTNPSEEEIPGFDPRRLLKLTIEGIQPQDLEKIPGLKVVSEESGKKITILFATADGLAEFKKRLDQVAATGGATRKEILWAIQRFDDVSPEDRTGPALTSFSPPKDEAFSVDVELWPLDLIPERTRMLENFREWCRTEAINILDEVNNSAIVLLRVQLRTEGLARVLKMRDVRTVDLPPRYQLDFTLLRIDSSELPSPEPPADGAPGVVLLDSGIATNHPLFENSIGDAQGFSDSGDAEDFTGHGTHIGGLALYGSIEEGLAASSLSAECWLFSGRISDSPLGDPSSLLEKRIEEAVVYFTENYGCRVFNLSFGDESRVYQDGHVDRLAATLDALSREYGVLFIVSAGNFRGTDSEPKRWRGDYPEYLLRDSARLIDPAPALNALTIGSLARHEGSHMAIRYPKDPAYQPVARRGEPSPFSRSGPGPRGAIKPELVEYGGNFYVDTRQSPDVRSPGTELGEVSTSFEFATGNLFAVDLGTSQAAGKVSNLAGRLLAEYPTASANLLRALLVAHAEVPEATLGLLSGDPKKVTRLVGYGVPRLEESRFSSENRVTMVAEERIGAERHHFYEVPMPDDFFAAPARRQRRISVALSHMPRVRRTRIDYKETALQFRIVRAQSIEDVTQAYRRLKKNEVEEPIPETQGFFPSPNYRKGGTVQAASKRLKQVNRGADQKPYFVVVTSQQTDWASDDTEEPYALVIVIEDQSEAEVQLYSQVRALLRARAQARSRT